MRTRCPVCQGVLSEIVSPSGDLLRYHCRACGRDFHIAEIHAVKLLEKKGNGCCSMNKRQRKLRGYTEEERRVLYGPLVYSRDGRFVIFGNKAYDEREYHSVKDLLIDEALRNGYPPSVVTNYAPLRRLRPVQVRGREHDYVKEHLEQVFEFEDRMGKKGVIG